MKKFFSMLRKIQPRSEPIGSAGYKILYREYFRSARKKKYEFKLTLEEFKDRVIKCCFYCGSPPNCKTRSIGWMPPANGLDRINADKGYTVDNVVPCCSVCNLMKKRQSMKDFLRHIERIYLKNKTFMSTQKD